MGKKDSQKAASDKTDRKPRKKKAADGAGDDAKPKKRGPAATGKKPSSRNAAIKAAGMGMTSAPARKPTREDIAHRAYDIWERQGRPEGKALDNWMRAEKELQNERG